MARRPVEGTRETTVQRIARRAEEDRQDNRAGFKAVLESIETLRTEVRRGAQNTGLLEQRLNDLEFQVNLTRDEVQRRALNPAPSQIASAKTAIKDAAKSPAGRLATWLAIVVSAFVIAGNVDDVIRYAERFWAFLAGREVPAVAPKVPEK
jgi:hypothetical protein